MSGFPGEWIRRAWRCRVDLARDIAADPHDGPHVDVYDAVLRQDLDYIRDLIAASSLGEPIDEADLARHLTGRAGAVPSTHE